jgi:hypothetical protein
MAGPEATAHGEQMPLLLRKRPELAASAHQMQRAAGEVLRDTSAPDAVPALPAALAHLEEALDRLSTSMVKAAQAVEEWPDGAEGDAAALSSDARALRWHLFHLATRLQGAEDACPEARRWARRLLDAERQEDRSRV